METTPKNDAPNESAYEAPSIKRVGSLSDLTKAGRAPEGDGGGRPALFGNLSGA